MRYFLGLIAVILVAFLMVKAAQINDSLTLEWPDNYTVTDTIPAVDTTVTDTAELLFTLDTLPAKVDTIKTDSIK